MKKLSRIYILGAIALVTVVLGLLLVNVNKTTKSIPLADKKINELLASTAYKESSHDERKELAYEMLSALEREKYITHLSYDETNDLFSFQYTNGTLGGIYLNDFSHQPDDLPKN